MGQATFAPDCSATEITKLNQVRELIAYMGSSPAYELCVSSDIASHYLRRPADPAFADPGNVAGTTLGVLKAVINSNPWDVQKCHAPDNCDRNPSWAAATLVESYGNTTPDWIKFRGATMDRWAMQQWPLDTIAGAVTHETLHQHGFVHEPPGAPGWPMTDIVSTCADRVGFQSLRDCNFAPCGVGGSGRMMVTAVGSGTCQCVARSCFDFADTDQDGVGDACDSCPSEAATDFDGDGKCSTDNCPMQLNPFQSDVDGDGLGDACDSCPTVALPDFDGDGRCGAWDNCPSTWNPVQGDLDLDGLGNECDPDLDGDGVANGNDNCRYDLNNNQKDADGNGVGDACDCSGFVISAPPASCSSVQIRWRTNLELERRIFAIASAILSQGGPSGPYGPWHLEAHCAWGCPGFKATDSRAYADTLSFLESSPAGVRSTVDVRTILKRDDAVKDEALDLFLPVRFGGRP